MSTGKIAVIFPIAFLSLFSVAAINREQRTLPLDRPSAIEQDNVDLEVTVHDGRRALRVLENQSHRAAGFEGRTEAMAILPDSELQNGTIEVELTGKPRAGAAPNARGFAGISFRVQPHASAFECFYLRPTNGRADDQLRRNHSTQYISYPSFSWEKLRAESPGVYESYADLQPGVWTKMKIVVDGKRARLYVNGAAQPCLIVNDLKNGETSGAIALWVGLDTEAYFRNLKISPR